MSDELSKLTDERRTQVMQVARVMRGGDWRSLAEQQEYESRALAAINQFFPPPPAPDPHAERAAKMVRTNPNHPDRVIVWHPTENRGLEVMPTGSTATHFVETYRDFIRDALRATAAEAKAEAEARATAAEAKLAKVGECVRDYFQTGVESFTRKWGVSRLLEAIKDL